MGAREGKGLSKRRAWWLRAGMAATLAITIGVAGLVPPKVASGGGIPVLRLRKNVKDLTPQERTDLVNAIYALKRVRSPWNRNFSYYDQFVWWHRNTFFCNINAAHMVPSFPVWHREFILLFENALRQVSGKPITLPYWDWTDPASTRAALQLTGGNGNPKQGWALTNGPFRKGLWHLNVVDQKDSDVYGLRYIVRRFGSFGSGNARTLPQVQDVRASLRVPNYDVPPYDPSSNPNLSFRNNLEGWRDQTGMACGPGNLMNPTKKKGTTPRKALHNLVHLYVGGQATFPKNPNTQPVFGTMDLNTSLNDPIFWLHHANVDRIYWEWEQRHGEKYVPIHGFMYGHNLHDFMWPYRNVGLKVSPAMMLDIHKLGYTYSKDAKD